MRHRQVSRDGLPAGLAVADYGGMPQQIVHEFKSRGSNFLASLMVKAMLPAITPVLGDPRHAGRVILIPAPSRRAITRMRGYQPASLLAKEMALQLRASGVPAIADQCMVVNHAVADQSRLDAKAREENMNGQVRLLPGSVARLRGRRLVLVDDVVTTGATLRAMRSALAEQGLETEIFLTFAETL